MKHTTHIIIFAIALFAFMAIAHAQSPREQLKQMVEQLQKTPDDNVLREKIIRLTQLIKPAPAIPDKAIEYEGRAQFAFKSAKSEADFIAAAREYENAIAIAPWVPGYYADLCTIYEKAGRFEDAKRNCESYLTGLTDSAQMTDVKRRIAGLKFGIEKANSPEAHAARERETEQRFIASLEGAHYVCPEFRIADDATRVEIDIKSGKISGANVITWINPKLTPGVNYASNAFVGFRGAWGPDGEIPLQGKVSIKSANHQKMRVEIDGDRLEYVQEITYSGESTPDVYPAQICLRTK